MILVLACILLARSVLGQWSCTQDAQCSDVAGSVCRAGACACPLGQQIAGSRCADLAPYHTSTCVENHQCSRMFSFFECRQADGEQEAACRCQDGFHYFHGRCWRSISFGEPCTTDEECLDIPRDPYSLRCDVTCACAEGYYERQRGECRKIAYTVGEGCVLDQDCQFANGVCNIDTRTCGLTSVSATSPNTVKARRANVTSTVLTSARAVRQHGSACNASTACGAPFECSLFGACVCPVGYYASADGGSCLAELGSVSTPEQCVGFLAEVVDGVCACPPNFYYEENMRDCIKVTRRITDSCTTDENCHTFGSAAFCGPPQEPWPLRSCECDLEQAVWDSARQMCRLFAGVGEMCEVDSDCLAGELEIQCSADETGQGYCVCPDEYISVDGLCLTSGLSIGDACQASQECTETANTACVAGACACDNGYQLMGDFCAPIIGGTCAIDTDCVIDNTLCRNDSGALTCQCNDNFVAYNDICWPESPGYGGVCNNTAQCAAVMGEHGVCAGSLCNCQQSYHFRDGNCWPVTHLFDSCGRTSECYLSTMSDRVVCRNSMCQCDFNFPYSEAEHTCVSSATGVFGSTIVIMAALVYLIF